MTKSEKLIQYVITTLLNETILDKENVEVILPWNMKYVNVMANFGGIDRDLHNPALDLSGNMAYQFWDMMETVYGLTFEEVEKVWKIYGPTLAQRMQDAWMDDWKNHFDEPILDEAKATINPNTEDEEDPYSFAWHPEPKKRKFYEAVLRDVVSASIIGWDGVISVGDIETSHKKGLDFHNIYHAYDVTPFLHHLKDTYGLLDKETHPIWSRWEHIMVDKMKKWLKSKDISWNDGDYDVGVDYADEHIWDGNE